MVPRESETRPFIVYGEMPDGRRIEIDLTDALVGVYSLVGNDDDSTSDVCDEEFDRILEECG